MVEIRAQAHAAAPLATTWSILADQSGMAAWTPARKVMIEHQGDPRPAGVGTIRVLSLVLLKIREQITAPSHPDTTLAWDNIRRTPGRSGPGEGVGPAVRAPGTPERQAGRLAPGSDTAGNE